MNSDFYGMRPDRQSATGCDRPRLELGVRRRAGSQQYPCRKIGLTRSLQFGFWSVTLLSGRIPQLNLVYMRKICQVDVMMGLGFRDFCVWRGLNARRRREHGERSRK
jgi:hypothetical protein